MTKKNVRVKINEGPEARPVAMLVQIASQFRCKVHVETENKKINAKSIMGMMALGIIQGDELTIVADGEDENAAVERIEKYLTGQAQ